MKDRVFRESFSVYLADNVQAWMLQADGSYRIRRARGGPLSAQERLLGMLSDPSDA